MDDLWTSLKLKDKPIFIYGMGNGADLIIHKLSTVGITAKGVFSSDDFVRGQTFRDFKVKTYNEVKNEYGDIIVLTAFGTQIPSVIDNIKKIADEQELYIPDAPVYGRTFFDKDFYKTHKNELNSISDRFADERSKTVFQNIVNFKLSGVPKYLFKAEDQEEKELKNILNLQDGSTIYDLGAFIGDTVEKFISLCPNYGKIVAVEPDIKNYTKLLSNTNNIHKVECVNAAIGYLNGNVFFGGLGGRNQSVHSGKNTVKSLTVDTLCERFGRPHFIKYDIEGEELNGIIGAENTIKQFKPKLMISAYHRSDDIISIPRKVLSIRDDYKMYIRHFPYIPCWDTYYFFI